MDPNQPEEQPTSYEDLLEQAKSQAQPEQPIESPIETIPQAETAPVEEAQPVNVERPAETIPQEEPVAVEQSQPEADQAPTASYDQPVAYGQNGEPLYARPVEHAQPGPQFVHLSRAVDPVKPTVSPEHKQKHDDSMEQYPFLSLSDQEYIVAAVRRHPIGLIGPIAIAGILILVLIGLSIAYGISAPDGYAVPGSNVTLPGISTLILPVILLILLVVLGCYIACRVYLQNKFFLTNESVIEEIQKSLFAHDEQTISLANIEDVSFAQTGVMQHAFNYGQVRMSTEGEESTYEFNYVIDPKHQAAILNNAVEAFKNGRPVDPS